MKTCRRGREVSSFVGAVFGFVGVCVCVLVKDCMWADRADEDVGVSTIWRKRLYVRVFGRALSSWFVFVLVTAKTLDLFLCIMAGEAEKERLFDLLTVGICSCAFVWLVWGFDVLVVVDEVGVGDRANGLLGIYGVGVAAPGVVFATTRARAAPSPVLSWVRCKLKDGP